MALSLALFLPMMKNPATTTLAIGGGDLFQNLWGLWWVKYALFIAHVGVFSTTNLLFWPVGANLVFQTLAPVSGFISIPLQSWGLPFAYNFLFFLGFVLTGLGAFILVEYLTKNAYASFFGGLVFTFGAFHIAQELGHIAFFNIGFTALFLYFFLRMVEEKRVQHALGASACFFFVFFMDGVEEGIIAVLAALFILVVYRFSREKKELLGTRLLGLLFLSALIFVILGLFWIIPAIQTAMAGGLSAANQLNSIQNNMQWSDDLLTFFMPSYYNGIFNGAAHSYYNALYGVGGPQDRIAYIGYTALALGLYGLYKNAKMASLWLVLLIIFGLLSLGPFPQIGSNVIYIPGPYLSLHLIPIFNLIREPGRFALMVSLCFAVLSGFGIKTFLEGFEKHKNPRMKTAVLSIVSLVFILESAGIPTTALASQLALTPYIPLFIKNLNYVPGNFSFLSLPALPQPNKPAFYTGLATYYTTVLNKPLVGGYLTRFTPVDFQSLYSIPFAIAASNLEYTGSFNYSSLIVENSTLQSLKTLSDYNTAFIIVQNPAYGQANFQTITNYLAGVFGPPVYGDYNVTVFYTFNAIRRTNFYKNQFISYYQPSHWIFLSTTNSSLAGWVPINQYGVIVIYAPYPAVNASATNQSFINATMQFTAASFINQSLIVQLQKVASNYTANENHYVTISPDRKRYAVKMRLASGPIGNAVGFFYKYLDVLNSSYAVFISNLTLSAAG